MPTPRPALSASWARLTRQHTAVLALILLGFGIFLGAAAGPRSADTLAANLPGRLSLRLPGVPAAAPPIAAPPAAQPASVPSVAATPSPSAGPQTTPAQTANASSAPTGVLSTAGSGLSSAPPANPAPTAGGPTPSNTAPTADPPVPRARHVFLISLADQDSNGAFASPANAPYLDGTLVKQGTLLSNFYAIGHGSLADGVALISGQGPNPATQSGCGVYSDVAPGTRSREGQVAGQGCVYPARVRTLPGQLTTAKRTWRAYLEDSANGGPGVPATCRHPTIGNPDATQQARPGDAYATYRNPFVFFHSIIDRPTCATADVGLEQLTADLTLGKGAPAFSYIVPNLCHDGSTTTCAAGAPAGMAAADAFLRAWVPAILASPAYRDDGLLVILPDQAPASGTGADSSACCDTPTFPSTPNAGGPLTPGQGGGKVGLLILSAFVRHAAVVSHAYNDFSLLRTIENIFGRRHLGYAARADVQAFGPDVWTAASTRRSTRRGHAS